MPPVEPQTVDTPMQLRLAKTAAWIAGVLALVTSILIILNFIQMRRIDPLESTAMETLIGRLSESPQDEQLIQEIRALDVLARKAFFSSRTFKKSGAFLLLGSLAVLLIALRIVMNMQKTLPLPGPTTTKSAYLKTAHWSRWAIATAFGALIIIALTLNLMTEPTPRSSRAAKNDSAPLAQSTEESPTAAVASSAEERQTPPIASTAEESQIPTADSETTPVQPEIAAAAPEPRPQISKDDMKKNWPAFRGYRSLGIATAKEVPTTWDGEAGTHVRWKVEVPRPGFSSPIVWSDKVWVTGGDDTAREIFCYSADTGALLWRHAADGIEGSPAQPPKVTPDTGHAASTPTTNGTAVFAIFSTGDVVCVDFDGKRLWARNLGVPKNHYGHSSSLITWNDLLLVQYDHGESGRLLALDQKTGKTRWETKRDTGISWSSPIIADTGTRDEVILTANPLVAAYDPKTGESLWQVSCLSGEVGPSAAFAEGRVFAVNEYAILAAIALPSLEILWETDYDLSEVSSPLAIGPHVFLGTSDGAITCFDAKTGDRIWQEFFDYGFYASPIWAEGRIYLIDNSGTMHVFMASAEYTSVAQSPLSEDSYSTPAIVDGAVYCRGATHLYRLGPK